MSAPFGDPTGEDIPSYEESIQQGADAASSSDAKGPVRRDAPLSLPQQLSAVRTQRIHAIITSYIDPLLQSQAAAGLFRTTLVLVPSNTTSLQSPEYIRYSSDIIEGSGDAISHNNEESVIGFPSEDYVKLVRLHGEDYTAEFWRQPAVIAELDTSLKARLAATGHQIDSPGEPVTAPSLPPPVPVESPKAKKGGFFARRKASETIPTAAPVPSTLSAGTWKLPEKETLGAGHVRIKIGLQEVCLRVITQMGLYETRTGKAVVVNIEIGS